MPKVTEAHRAARREQILRAALRCVGEEGFHKTTMASVIRESGLSAGAVYLYFRSKKDLIRAIAGTGVSGVAEAIRGLAEADEVVLPEEALTAAATRILEVGEELGVYFPNLALQTWAEAARDPEVRTVMAAEAQRIRAAWIAYAERAIAAGHTAPDADPEEVGTSLMGMLPGFIVLRVLTEEISPERYAAGLKSLRR
jgi:AcrR family transcriptional regulator